MRRSFPYFECWLSRAFIIQVWSLPAQTQVTIIPAPPSHLVLPALHCVHSRFSAFIQKLCSLLRKPVSSAFSICPDPAHLIRPTPPWHLPLPRSSWHLGCLLYTWDCLPPALQVPLPSSNSLSQHHTALFCIDQALYWAMGLQSGGRPHFCCRRTLTRGIRGIK